MKINWTESRNENSRIAINDAVITNYQITKDGVLLIDLRIAINDAVITNYADERDLPEQFSLREVAESYAATYDHNGNDETFTVAKIEDLGDGETHRFAFDGNGNFEWNTDRPR